MMNKLLFLFTFLPIITLGQNRNDQLALKPLLGWNSYDSYGVYLYEKVAYDNLDTFVRKLKPYGYDYFVIDAGWWGEYKLIPGTMYSAERHAKEVAMDEYGRVEPSEVYFPNGLKPLIDRAHKFGVKFGVHIMRGIPRKAVELNLPVLGTKYYARDIVDTTSICTWNPQNYGVDMTKPGAQEYYNSLFKKLADWGIDFVKVDDMVPYPKEIIAVAKAIKNSGRDMVYSLSPGGNANLKDLPYYTVAEMVRITSDIWDNQASIDRSFKAWRIWQGIGYPGFWPDMDMIPFGELQLMQPEVKNEQNENVQFSGEGYSRHSRFTKPQMRTFLTQRALATSPIIVGGDLPTLDDYSLSLLTNKDMLACNQNGHTGTLIEEHDGIEMWATCIPDIRIKGWIGFFNRSDENREIILNKEKLKLVSYYGFNGMEKVVLNWFKIKDIWGNQEYEINNNDILVTIAPGDVLFLYYEEGQ